MGSAKDPLGGRESFWVDGNISGSLWAYGVDHRNPVVHGNDSKMPCTEKDCSTISFYN